MIVLTRPAASRWFTVRGAGIGGGSGDDDTAGDGGMRFWTEFAAREVLPLATVDADGSEAGVGMGAAPDAVGVESGRGRERGIGGARAGTFICVLHFGQATVVAACSGAACRSVLQLGHEKRIMVSLRQLLHTDWN
jgi:hypothetical protein